MGCSESKSSIAAGNTVTQNKKPDEADYLKKVEKEVDVVVQQGEAKAEENKGPEDAAGVDVKEAIMVAEVEKKDYTVKEKLDENVREEKEPELEKENGENEAAKNEEGSTKEAEPAPAAEAPPAVTIMANPIVPKEANSPPEKKES